MEQAIEHLTKLAADFPQVPDYRAGLPFCYGNLGNMYENMGDWDRCVQLTRKALDVAAEVAAKYPKVTRYEDRLAVELLRLAERLVGQGELAEAQILQKDGLAHARSLHESYPDNTHYPSLIVPGNYLLASIDAALGQSAEGPRLRQEADKIFDETYKQLRATRGSSSAALFCADVARQLQDFAWAWKRTGNHEQMAKAYEQANKALGQAIKLELKNVGLWLFLAHGYLKLEQRDEAIACYRKAIELDPKNAGAQNYLGIAVMRQGKLDEAVADLRKAIKLDPKFASAYNTLGVALIRQGKFDEAIACYRKAIELNPKDAIIHNNLAFALAEQRKLDEAAAYFGKASKLDQENPLYCYWHGLALLSGGDLPGYRAACADMLKRFGRTKKPDVAELVAWTAVLAPKSVDQLDQPVRMAESALRSNAKNQSCSTTLGAAQYRAGRFAEAVQQLEKVVRALEQDATKPGMVSPAYAAFFLAMTHQRMGHDAEARQWLGKASKRMEQEMQDRSNEASKSWNRRCTLELLRREAEALLKDMAPANPEPELVPPPKAIDGP
jgi:tetratricopeptide (TPR) repeat protein